MNDLTEVAGRRAFVSNFAVAARIRRGPPPPGASRLPVGLSETAQNVSESRDSEPIGASKLVPGCVAAMISVLAAGATGVFASAALVDLGRMVRLALGRSAGTSP